MRTFDLQEVEISICGITLTEWKTGDVVIIRGRRFLRLEALRRRRREFDARFEAYRERIRRRRRLIRELLEYWRAGNDPLDVLPVGFSLITWPIRLEELGE